MSLPVRARQAAFTLVELSIVLVILGLLVGGVLAGQSLIHAAELRAITTEKKNIDVALNAFREKYMGIPGDLPNAFAFWGAGCGTNTTAASTGCNGDGNGTIETSKGEGIKTWEHLSLAGLIEGSYDGTGAVSGMGGDYLEISTSNIMKSKYANAYWDIGNFFYGAGGYDGAPAHWSGRTYLNFGNVGTPASLPYLGIQTTMVPSLTNTDAWNIDVKTDDGRGNSGAMIGDGYPQRGTGYGYCFDFQLSSGDWDYYNMSGMEGSDAGGADKAGECQMHWVVKP